LPDLLSFPTRRSSDLFLSRDALWQVFSRANHCKIEETLKWSPRPLRLWPLIALHDLGCRQSTAPRRRDQQLFCLGLGLGDPEPRSEEHTSELQSLAYL